MSHVPTARLRIPYRKLAKLHPAQIADLVEQASHDEGEEIIEAVGLDRELEADVFEELDTTHQLEFLESRSDAESARLLSRMEPDNAADLITEIDQERRLPILELLPSEQQAKVRQLLSLQRRHRRRDDEPRLRLGRAYGDASPMPSTRFERRACPPRPSDGLRRGRQMASPLARRPSRRWCARARTRWR